jgi:serine/threonine-protein kinase RsbW
MDETVLHLRNDTAELERLAAELSRFGAAHGLGERDLFQVTLALDEVVTNVISYAYEDETEHDIEVHLRFDAGTIEMRVVDDGRPFDPLDVAPVDAELEKPIEERRAGGLGVHLVRKTMDALEYRREMGKNVLTMRKRVSRRMS